MKDATEIVLLVDESGSMSGLRKDTIGSINTFVKDQAKVPGEANLELVVFQTLYDGGCKIIRSAPVKTFGEITEADYTPLGGTPLLDAIAQRVDALGAKLAAIPESDRPDKVIFVIITDGEENSSKKASLADVKAKIQEQTDVYNWQFIYLGAGINAFKQHEALGISFASSAQYVPDSGDSIKAVYSSVSHTIRGVRANDGPAIFNAQQRQDMTGSGDTN